MGLCVVCFDEFVVCLSELRQVALHGCTGTYLIFHSLWFYCLKGFMGCAQILSVGLWESLFSPLCPSTLGLGRHKPFILWWGSRRVIGLSHSFWRLLRHVRRGSWAKKPGKWFLLSVFLSHAGTSHLQVTHGADMKLITCFKTEQPCFCSRSQYVSKHNAKCLPWSRKP